MKTWTFFTIRLVSSFLTVCIAIFMDVSKCLKAVFRQKTILKRSQNYVQVSKLKNSLYWNRKFLPKSSKKKRSDFVAWLVLFFIKFCSGSFNLFIPLRDEISFLYWKLTSLDTLGPESNWVHFRCTFTWCVFWNND